MCVYTYICMFTYADIHMFFQSYLLGLMCVKMHLTT